MTAQRGKESGICRLCGLEADLCDSHVLSEFLYKPLYDEKHSAISVSPAEADRPGKIHKGVREKLLCSSCEGILGRSETYVAQIMPGVITAIQAAAPNTVYRVPADYTRLKLFQLSILWRASVADGPNFQAVSIGAAEPEIRDMLLRGNPGAPTDYPCIAVAPTDNAQLVRVIDPARSFEIQGVPGFRFLFSGIYWFFFLTKDPSAVPPKLVISATVDELAVGISLKTGTAMLRVIAGEIRA